MSADFNYNKNKPKIIKSPDGNNRIRCRVRKIQVYATPEEKVRQSFLNYLIDEKKFPQRSIEVEKNFAHYQSGVLDRADIVVNDDDGEPLVIYECKKDNHGFTDEFIDQGMRYLSHIQECPYLGFVSGSKVILCKQNGPTVDLLQPVESHPNYLELCEYDVSFEKHIDNPFHRYDFTHPVDIDVLDEFFYYGWFGKKTEDKYHSFLVNFNNWLLDFRDEIPEQKTFKDIGTTFTKFGNAGGGSYLGQYRAIMNKTRPDQPVFCLSISSSGSEKSGFGTLIYMGIKSPKARHSCLQLRINTSVSTNDDKAFINHSGSMTVGKLGALKRKVVLDYVKENSSDLVVDGKVYLGEFNLNEAILSNQSQTIDFLRRITEYGLLREELREITKKTKK